jgi:hypothetical protein
MKRNGIKKEIKFIEKEIKLSAEFDDYIINHPHVFGNINIPRNPCIIITDPSDKDFNNSKIKLSKEVKNCFIAEKANGKWILSPAN